MELPIIYKNNYGELILEPLGDLMHVQEVDGRVVINDGYSYDIHTAAVIALITDNKSIQQCYNMEHKAMYCLLHYTPSRVRVAKVTIVKCNISNPHAEIERCHKSKSGYLL